MRNILFIILMLTAKVCFGAYNEPVFWGYIQGKPDFATVATTGSYNDLANKPAVPMLYNSSGVINQTPKIWFGSVAPDDATDYAIDISSAGFNQILSYTLTIKQSDVTTWAQVEDITTTTLTIDLYQVNSNLVNILGNLVLLGTPTIPANNFTGLTLNVQVTGY